MGFPLGIFADWSPFHLDALGLVTLLGADAVTNAVGALEHNRYTEFLPLFGTYQIAENKFTRPIPGFALYNISDGVYVPILNGWFCRWLIAHLTENVTILEWMVEGDEDKVQAKRRRLLRRDIVAMMIGLLANGGLILLAGLQGDYYGLANTIAMGISVLVRCVMVRQTRVSLNLFIDDCLKKDKHLVKIAIVTPDNKLVAFRIPRGLLKCVFFDIDPHWRPATSNLPKSRKESGQDPEAGLNLIPSLPMGTSKSFHKASSTTPNGVVTNLQEAQPLPQNKGPGCPPPVSAAASTAVSPDGGHIRVTNTWLLPDTSGSAFLSTYASARGVGWLAFAVHVICIGQSFLLTQILTIVLLISSTIMTVQRIGNAAGDIGDNVTLNFAKRRSPKNHRDAFLYLDPTQEEQLVMKQFLLLPHAPGDGDGLTVWNKKWWAEWDMDHSRNSN
ncbi:hypothetical protein DPV78_006128 [Talaromyces pinophilus]|nr:hypothetical protein DPV78_006128 [Talaromyces pinophilus]